PRDRAVGNAPVRHGSGSARARGAGRARHAATRGGGGTPRPRRGRGGHAPRGRAGGGRATGERTACWSRAARPGRRRPPARAARRPRRLAGSERVDAASRRGGYPIPAGGETVGTVTSGNYGPSVDRQIGMGFVPPALAGPGTELGIVVRQRTARARVTPLPF